MRRLALIGGVLVAFVGVALLWAGAHAAGWAALPAGLAAASALSSRVGARRL